MERYVLDNLEASVPFEEVAAKLKLTEEDDLDELRGLYDGAMAVARPKAVWRVCYVDGIDGDDVTVDGIAFRSRVLAGNLAGVHRVFAYVVTCGTEADEYAHAQQDYVVRIWMDMLKEMILRAAREQFLAHVKKAVGTPKLSSMSPGSGNLDTWPIRQQTQLFGLIGNVREDIGVTLTPSMLMDPNKSVSGILFPSEKGYVGCALCRRENCPGRKVPFDASLASSLE